MSVTQYIGARYVPLFADPIEWSSTNPYEPLTIVTYQGNSYTSRQSVPAGLAAPNDASVAQYWALTGNYNAQIEQYRREVATFDGRISDNADAITDEIAAREAADTALSGDLADEVTAREAADTALSGDLADEVTAREAADNALDEVIQTKESTVTISGNAVGCLAFNPENGMPEHPGAICDIGNGTQIVISSPSASVMMANRTNNGHARFISIERNEDNWNSAKVLNIGHSNSMCYDNEYIYVVPSWDYSSGSAVADNNINVYDTNMQLIKRILAPVQMNAISYDWVTGKIYCIGRNNSKLYELLSNDTFREIATLDIIIADHFNQDMAVYNGVFYKTSANNYYARGNVETGEIYNFGLINEITADGTYKFLEIDGMEFTKDGILLALANVVINDDIQPTLVLELYTQNAKKSLREFKFGHGTNKYTFAVNQTTEQLRAYKDIPSLTLLLLAPTACTRIALDSDYIGALPWTGRGDLVLGLQGHTCEIKDVFRVSGDFTVWGAPDSRLVMNLPISNDYTCTSIKFASTMTVEGKNNTTAVAVSGSTGVSIISGGTVTFNNIVKLFTVNNIAIPTPPFVYLEAPSDNFILAGGARKVATEAVS